MMMYGRGKICSSEMTEKRRERNKEVMVFVIKGVAVKDDVRSGARCSFELTGKEGRKGSLITS